MNSIQSSFPQTLVDRFQRRVDYLRLSVTDRCDFRCVYCMAEDMQFLPRREVLSLEELYEVARAFTQLGVSKVRLTGGEPLVRRGILGLVEQLGKLPGLRELALTTNGSQLTKMAPALREGGITSVNISLDTLDAERFRELTRTGDLEAVLRGIEAAVAAGFDRIRLNAVILRGRNDHEVLDLVRYAREQAVDITFIEEMPLGHIVEHDRGLSLASSAELQRQIDAEFPLQSQGDPSGAAGPARYFRMADSTSRVGFISPHSNNFCHLCNRVRLTVSGRLLLCLGNEHSVDLREVLRRPGYDSAQLVEAIVSAMNLKPERHHFGEEGATDIVRFMNMTGG
ncbi:GTP 3',8-cyclase MoaA [Parahaliea maris]|uniref:GTP 3',8-cyclase n=1 Tax=Parahaliea maris TaxID=2716870 RepID=A0A5C9A3R3_9GAMM|nr:GTP 3',8-cyclase MoaA [Parahaliea maris]TXS94267.1 GTP 3',8-cyclase MoaA [Parahaliea maris]